MPDDKIATADLAALLNGLGWKHESKEANYGWFRPTRNALLALEAIAPFVSGEVHLTDENGDPYRLDFDGATVRVHQGDPLADADWSHPPLVDSILDWMPLVNWDEGTTAADP